MILSFGYFFLIFLINLLKNKEMILFVPKSHLITLEMAKDTLVGKKIIATHISLLSPKHSFLSIFLL